MAKGVVDQLEAVQVDQREYQRRVGVAVSGERLVEQPIERRAVGDAGQYVGVGGATQLSFQRVAVGHVLQHADDRDGAAVHAFQLGGRMNAAALAPRGVDVFLDIHCRAGLDRARQRGADPRAGFGRVMVERLRHVERSPVERMDAVSTVRPLQPIRHEVEAPGTDLRDPLRLAQRPVALGQGGDVPLAFARDLHGATGFRARGDQGFGDPRQPFQRVKFRAAKPSRPMIDHAHRADCAPRAVLIRDVQRNAGVEAHATGRDDMRVGGEARVRRQILDDQRSRAPNGEIAHRITAADLRRTGSLARLDPQPVAVDQRQHARGTIEQPRRERDQHVELRLRCSVEQVERMQRREPTRLVIRAYRKIHRPRMLARRR